MPPRPRPGARQALVLAPLLVVALLVSGCHQKAEPPKTAAGGELLPRSANDEMIAYDSLRSQPPLASPGASDEDEYVSTPHAAAPDETTIDNEAEDDTPSEDDAPVEAVPAAPTQP